MPTYQYACQKCGHEFEFTQSMKDTPIATCPADRCARKRWGKGKVVRRIGTGAGLIFKGSGFYITDYRSESYKAAAKKDVNPATTTPAATPAGAPGSGSGTGTAKPSPAGAKGGASDKPSAAAKPKTPSA